MRQLRVLLLAAAALIMGCATTTNYQSAMMTWHGASVRQLMDVWGYPQAIRRLPNGSRLYVYQYEQRGRNPIYTTPGYTTVTHRRGQTIVHRVPTTVSGGGSYDYRCITYFEVNRRQRIVGTSFRGNSCVMTQRIMRKRSRPDVMPKPITQRKPVKKKTVSKKTVNKLASNVSKSANNKSANNKT